MAEHVIGMYLLHGGTPRDRQAWQELAAGMPEARLTEPDDLGVFEVTVDSRDEESALLHVWNAVAATGQDDHVVFLEHPSLPEHWRERSGGPS
jgi:hypothetical protein